LFTSMTTAPLLERAVAAKPGHASGVARPQHGGYACAYRKPLWYG
jgi:hypothetical protein